MPNPGPKPLPTTIGFPTLADWEAEGVPLFARCRVCGREVCLMPRSYTLRFGRQTSFWRTMKRLRCTICRAAAADAEVFDAMLSRADEAKKSDGDYREKPRSERASR